MFESLRQRGAFAAVDRAAGASPADGGEPGAGRGHGAGLCDEREGTSPSVEPCSRATGIDCRRGAQMLSEIEEHVDQPAAYFTWGSKCVGVVTVAPDRALASRASIDGPRASNRQPLHPPRQRALSLGFDDQMQMVGLHREMNEAKRSPATFPEPALQLPKNHLRAKRGNPPDCPQRDVHRMSFIVLRPAIMRRSASIP